MASVAPQTVYWSIAAVDRLLSIMTVMCDRQRWSPKLRGVTDMLQEFNVVIRRGALATAVRRARAVAA